MHRPPLAVSLAVVLAPSFLTSACARPPAPVEPRDTAALDAVVRARLGELLEAVRADPADGEARGQLGLGYEANRLWNEAEVTYGQAAELDPTEPIWPFRRAIALRHLGQLDAARELFAACAETRPDSAAVLHRYGDLLLESGEPERALELFRRVCELAPDRTEGFTGVGAALLEEGRHAEAAEALERALALDRTYQRAHYLYGLALRGLGRTDEARRELALGLDGRTRHLPDRKERELRRLDVSQASRLERAIRLSESGRGERAVTILESVLEGEPENVEALIALGAAYMRLGDPKRGFAVLQDALVLDDERPLVWMNLATCLAAQGLLRGALQHADRAVELAPELAAAHAERGRILAKVGRHAEALPSLERAVALDPRDPDARRYLADTLTALDRRREALEHRSVLTDLRPDDLLAQLALASLALDLGDRPRAAEALAAARALAPDDVGVTALARRLADG